MRVSAEKKINRPAREEKVRLREMLEKSIKSWQILATGEARKYGQEKTVAPVAMITAIVPDWASPEGILGTCAPGEAKSLNLRIR